MSFGDPASKMHAWTLDPQESGEIVKHALGLGINFFDTANTYSAGTSEEYLGRAIKNSIGRDRVVLATKVYFNEGKLSKEAIPREVEGSLRRLGTDYIDLLIIHRFDYDTPIEETLEALHEVVQSGKVRAIGASAMYGYQFMKMQYAAEKNGWTKFVSMQNHYNLLYREDERELIPICNELNVARTPYRDIKMLVNAAGVSPSQAPVETILKVDLYGTAVLLEEVGKVISDRGTGVTISSQSGFRMPALTAKEDELLACTPTEELLELSLLQPENIRDTLHAYQLAKRCNEKKSDGAVRGVGKRGARLNAIAPGIIVTPLAVDEFHGPRGDFYKNMFAQCAAGRPGTADEVAGVAELLMDGRGAFISGATFLIDGGATASYYYGEK